jgi:hypothetical protein
MGGAWIALSWLIDKRESFPRRLLKASGVSFVLFVPETFKAEISYLSHFLGYVFGVLSAIIYYQLHKKQISTAEVVEEFVDDDSYIWSIEEEGHNIENLDGVDRPLARDLPAAFTYKIPSSSGVIK